MEAGIGQLTLVGITEVFIGCMFSLLVAWCYYRKASKKLREEANKLCRLNEAMLVSMQHAGWIILILDDEGHFLDFQLVVKPEGIPSEANVPAPTVTQTTPKE
ncbi:hypothetical protein FM038_017195 [Shewanella eurypsychrophilus]|uniref:Uncharacterized protein n=1 Tax=Shewanella eurypsychrophilus TaxID=2593656 RepID=A0ABX6V8I7_9GAMM|nr:MULTISPECIES: hypothetical protein [Shewanella]QFU23736.1 hypothetical protein FS418_18985 [Shewanella sp. YLB-09]QPG58956.1 hypothetical protein FM038_017195 [Shewanella eurypsychrophilus]